MASFPILVVDDDPNIVAVLRRAAQSTFVEADFIEVHSFTEAAQYLEGLRGRGPRLVLLDLDLQSELSGLDFLTLWRGHAQGRLVPVVVLSANQDQAKAGEVYVRGAMRFRLSPLATRTGSAMLASYVGTGLRRLPRPNSGLTTSPIGDIAG